MAAWNGLAIVCVLSAGDRGSVRLLPGFARRNSTGTPVKECIVIVLCTVSFSALAQVDRCTPGQESELSAIYDKFRSASRAGDLDQVKNLSTKAVSAEIAAFEKNAPNASSLARQMGSVMPALSEAKDVRCEFGGQRSRFIIRTEAFDRGSKKAIPITTIVMFERAAGQQWMVGEKAMTNPFSPQSPESLLQHEKLRLP